MDVEPRERARRGRSRRRAAVLLAALAALAALTSTCTSTVRPPRDPPEPQRVFVLEVARHRGLVLPDASSGWVEYAYGDYDWYALLANRWYHVFDTVLWPTPGALGRRAIGSDAQGRPAAGPGVVLRPLTVASARAQALERALASRYAARAGEQIHNAAYGLDFVPDEASFWAFHNCNDAVAAWLEALGCDVAWAPVRIGLVLDEAH